MGNNIKYMSGDFTPATPVGAIRHESPLLPFNNEVLVFHQDYVQLAANFAALDFNTPSTDITFPTAFLIDESPREDFRGNCLKWTRSWARIPQPYDMPGEIYYFTLPVFGSRQDGLKIPVALTIHRAFFLCGNHGVANGGYSQWQNIPVNQALRVIDADGITVLGNISSGVTLDETTTPTDAAYAAMITAGTQIQVEDSKISPWRGSIFVRDDYLITAV